MLIRANTAKVGNEQETSEGECDLSDDEADSKAPNGGDDGKITAKASTTKPIPNSPSGTEAHKNILNGLHDQKHGTGQRGQDCRKE